MSWGKQCGLNQMFISQHLNISGKWKKKHSESTRISTRTIRQELNLLALTNCLALRKSLSVRVIKRHPLAMENSWWLLEQFKSVMWHDEDSFISSFRMMGTSQHEKKTCDVIP